ncbi:MAG: hypothetical protein H8F28_03240 [Fibrella sp.]|nr:hypothetical protein [Armatimonadota bacterium]
MSRVLFQQSQNTDPVSVAPTQQVAAGEQHTHAIEPELLGVRPRTARWTEKTVAMRRLLWNLMVGTALILLFFARNDLATWDALIAHGVPVTASVYEKDVSRGKTTSYHLRYTFYGDGLLCYGTDSVSSAAFESANIGDTIPVTYLPGSKGEKWQQGTATVSRRDDRFYQWIFAGFFGVGAFAIGLALFENEMREQLRLLQHGRPAIGRVVSGNITTHKSTKTYWVRYEYTAYQNIVCADSVPVPQAAYEQYTLGNPYLTVVYDEAQYNKSKPYFQLTAAELAGR